MRRIISILFLSLLLLQAIPVLHFFSSHAAVFYAYVDEEKPDEKAKQQKEYKEILSLTLDIPVLLSTKRVFKPNVEKCYSSPLLEFLTPPPDAC